MPNKREVTELSDVHDALRLLAIIELCKIGASRDEVRDVLGSVDNNSFSRVNQIFNKRGRKTTDNSRGDRS
jgi:hypothetical protein